MPTKRTISQNAGRIIAQLSDQWAADIDAILKEGRQNKTPQQRVDTALDKLAYNYDKEIDVYRRILHEAEHGKVMA